MALKKEKVKGRIELIKVSDKFTVMLDYAHNAMSLESLLKTLRELPPAPADLPVRMRREPRQKPQISDGGGIRQTGRSVYYHIG